MKIIFPDKDYTLSLIFTNIDTLESRREQLFWAVLLTECFLRKSSCLHHLLPDKRDSVIYRQSTSRKKNNQIIADWTKKMLHIHLYRSACIIMICTIVVKYVLHINRCQIRSTVRCLSSVSIQLFAAIPNKLFYYYYCYCQIIECWR